MSNEVMVSRAKKLVDDGDVVWVNTNGNTHNFQGKGHNVSKDEVYLITAEIQENNEIEWSCNCRHNEFHDDCKHTIACGSSNDSWSLINTKELRVDYNDRTNDVDVVVGSVALKIESDDD